MKKGEKNNNEFAKKTKIILNELFILYQQQEQWNTLENTSGGSIEEER